MPHAFVDVLDHSVEASGLGSKAQLLELFLVSGGSNEGAVRGVGGEVGKEGLLLVFDFLDPAKSGVEEDIGTVAFGFHEAAVFFEDGVEVFVLGDVGAGAGVSLTDSARSVDEDLIEAAVFRLVVLFISEVPFSKVAGGVACRLDDFRYRGGLEAESLTFIDGVGDTISDRVAASHDSGPAGGAGGAHHEAIESK